MIESGNIYRQIPDDLSKEAVELLLQSDSVRIERIVSMGHKSPDTGWYDQAQNEWVIVLKGNAAIAFENDATVNLEQGDYINLPAHTKHRVSSTSPTTETVWLAVFY
jgi:cupin 2 domain-containing protein